MQRTGHWADADMLPLGHIGLRAERGDDRQSKLTCDEQKTLLTLWSMGRSPLMVGGDLPTSNADTIALLANPALREVTAGSSGNREIVRERLFAEWNVEESFIGELIAWTADAADWADAPQSPDGIRSDVRIEGEGEDRVIRGTIPAHGCLWFALD